MIEIAPSVATAPFRSRFGHALTVDANPQADGRTVDLTASLTDLPLDASAYDVLLVLHVLEHIEDDRKAMREIGRVLRPHGVAIIQVPLSGQPATDEEAVPSGADRLVRYGQADHVRFYGDDFFSRLSEEGLSSASVSPDESMPAELIQKYNLLPRQGLVFAVRADSEPALSKLVQFENSLRKGAL